MAEDGDTIVIEPGQYPENIVIKDKHDLTIRPLLDIAPQSVVIHGVKGGSGVVVIQNSSSITLTGVRIIGEKNSPKNLVSVSASSALIQKCSIENAGSSGLYIIRKSSVELIDNQIFGNFTGVFYYESRGVVRYCRIFSNRNNGLHVTKKSEVSVIHNTFHQNRTTGVLVEWASHGEVINNIFSANGTALRGGVGQISADYNLYDKNGIDNKGVKKGAHDLFADPLFKDAAQFDFSLKPGSPAKNSDGNGLDRGAMLPH
jgi:nitrous oxidase accessory protein NosD